VIGKGVYDKSGKKKEEGTPNLRVLFCKREAYITGGRGRILLQAGGLKFISQGKDPSFFYEGGALFRKRVSFPVAEKQARPIALAKKKGERFAAAGKSGERGKKVRVPQTSRRRTPPFQKTNTLDRKPEGRKEKGGQSSRWRNLLNFLGTPPPLSREERRETRTSPEVRNSFYHS